MAKETFDLATVADGLWLRMRDVILAERRLERFTFAPETPEGGASGPLSALAGDKEAASAMARDMALRAVAAGAEGVNFRILSGLGESGPGGEAPVGLGELARRVGLPELAVSERLNALAQAGLVRRDLERHAAIATKAGRGLVGLLEALGGALGERMSRGLPELLDS